MSCEQHTNKIVCRREYLPVLTLCLVIMGGVILSTQSGCQNQSAGPAAGGVRQPAPSPQPQEQASSKTEPVSAAGRPEAALPRPRVEPLPRQPQPSIVQAGQPAPRIKFDQVVYDFGDVSPGTKHIGQYKFSNTGDALLKVTNVRCCCGSSCKVAKYEYAPGEGGAVELEFHSSTEPGLTRRQLYVSSNDPQSPEVTLTVKANIVRMVDVEPKRLKLVLKQDNAGCGDITLTSLDGKPFSITGIQSTANAIKADFDPSITATKYVLKPMVNIESLQKQTTGRLSISLSHPECNSIDLIFDVLSQFAVEPPQLIVFNMEPGKPIKRTIWVLSNYNEDFEIESIQSKSEVVKVIGREKVGNRYQIEVEIVPPPADNKRKLVSDVLSIKMKSGEELSVACRGFY